jgi:hypothetical protein
MISVSITGCFDDDEIDIEKIIKTQDYRCIAWKSDNTEAVIIGEDYSLLYDPYEDALSNYWNDETGKLQDNPDEITYAAYDYKGKFHYISVNGWINNVNSCINFKLNCIDFHPSSNREIVVGNYGTIIDSGNSPEEALWNKPKIESGTTENLQFVDWNPNEEIALIVGENGVIIKYTSPQDIEFINFTKKIDLNCVKWHPSGNFAVIVGDNGTIIKYVIDELIDISNPDRTTSKLNCIDWKNDEGSAYIVGEDGLIIEFNMNDLIQIQTPTNNNLNAISWDTHGNMAFAVGEKGTILKTMDGIDFQKVALTEVI